MIKVLSGSLKGRKLKTIDLKSLRPTQAKVRKSIMDSIRVFDNKEVLDLFSGIGTLGIETLSRNAKKVTFVDNNYKILSILKKNLKMLEIDDKSTIINSDVLRFLSNSIDSYDLILADPPYRKYKIDDFFPLIKSLLKKDGIFCYESYKEKINIGDKKDMKIKYFGSTQVTFWEKKI